MNAMLEAGSHVMLDPLSLVDPIRDDLAFPHVSGEGTLPAMPCEGSADGFESIGNAGVEDLMSAYAAGLTNPFAVTSTLVSAIAESVHGREAILRLAHGYAQSAVESTVRWKNGNARPLEGIPFGIKDIIDVRDTMVTSGSHFTGHRIAPRDAMVVERLRAAGAIPFAMTATSEFACGSPHNPRYGAVTNPWDRSRWTGGSSTGSGAALAARLLPLALGTDTGGSIRVPSCWCGTTGLKPSRELVSRAGVAPLSWSLDHVGPMARSARDIAHVLPYMTERAQPELASVCAKVLEGQSSAGLRIGIPTNWFDEVCDQAVIANWKAALAVFEDLGCQLIELQPMDIGASHEAGWVILQAELASYHAERVEATDRMDAGMLHRLKTGLSFSALDYTRALQHRPAAQHMLLSAMVEVDVMVTPGLGSEAGFLDRLCVSVDGAMLPFQSVIPRNTMIFDLTGFPALMLPSGLGGHGLPTGIQIVARPGADALCLQLGASFQAATQYHRLSPRF
ncbi:amidase [Rhizobium sp.]|jgi:aspartyl-tRNA(Asn)/glutamyl-tRNA(Gln) amidotransferase subunit A|uniref:amidase n=1 Tax=Rhizobium sp. TaxID=391 RepID=UPI000E829210|nr:amidase [Rhizobium sp.]